MTPQPSPPGSSSVGSGQPQDLVGARELIAVQTFDIARLTTHAVPVVPGTFIAVSGVGPKGDSNGSGKTSFLAAITVLLADPQWRLDINGGQLAAGLLFKPDAAGLEADRVSPAPHGYIVGVFADPTDAADTQDTLLTVWIRLSATAPYLQVRWAAGLKVADAETDEERYVQADTIWGSIPPAQRCSARALQATLFGDAPRCMAYLDTTLRRATASLLSQQMTEMSPDAIGQSLIDLVGLRQFLEQEQEQRNALADQQRALQGAEGLHERRLQEERAELAAVANRQTARAALARGALMWRLHFARRYVDIVPEHEQATQLVEDTKEELGSAEADLADVREAHRLLANRLDLSEAEQSAREAWEDSQREREQCETDRAVLAANLGDIAAGRPRLLAAAEGWDGTPALEQERLLTDVQQDAADARARDVIAREAVREAADGLQQAEAGTPRDIVDVMRALDESGIPRVALADTLSIDQPARYWWEPVVHPWLSAVVVAPDDLDGAASAVSHLAGTIFVASDGPFAGDDGVTPSAAFPPGLSAGVPIGRFLHALADRHEHRSDPPRAVDAMPRITVIGGFESAVAGKQARVAVARAVLNKAEEEAAQRQRTLKRVELLETQTLMALDRSQAAEELARDDKEAERLNVAIEQCDKRTAALKTSENAAFETWRAADLLASQHSNQVDAAKRNMERAESAVGKAETALKKARTDRDALHLPYWRDGWANTLEAARHLLDEQDESISRLTAKRLRNRAQEALKEALDAYHLDVEELPADIRDVVDHREDLADGDDTSSGSRSFLELSRPLQTRLDGTAERDATTETTIRLDRARREETIATLRVEVNNRTADLEAIQDMIERSVEGHWPFY